MNLETRRKQGEICDGDKRGLHSTLEKTIACRHFSEVVGHVGTVAQRGRGAALKTRTFLTKSHVQFSLTPVLEARAFEKNAFRRLDHIVGPSRL